MLWIAEILDPQTARLSAAQPGDARANNLILNNGIGLDAALTSLGDAVIVTNANGKVSLLNSVAERITGWTNVEASGEDSKTVFAIRDENSLEVVESPADRVLREGNIVSRANQTLLRRRDGTEVCVDFSAAPMGDSQNNVVGVVILFRDNSDRRASESQLQQTVARLANVQGRMEAALLAGNIATWTIDLINDRVTGDALLAHLFSVRAEAAVNGTEPLQTYFNAIYEDDRDHAVQAIDDALKNDTPYNVDVRLELADGSLRWINSRGNISRDSTGRPCSMFGAVIDITELRREQEALRKSEQLLRDTQTRLDSALLAGEIAIWSFDVVADRVVADANLARLFSVDPAAASGGELGVYLAAIHPEDLPRVTRDISDAIASGAQYESEYRVVLPDGFTRWLVARGKVERDEAGRPVSLPGIVVDITRAKEAEARISQSEDQYRALFGSMAQGVLYRDAETQIVISANPAAERILGLTLSQMQGRNVADSKWKAVNEDGSPMERDDFPSSRALATGKPVRGYIQGIFNPQLDELRWLRVDAVPQYLPGETRPFRVYSLFEDITEQRALQQEQAQLYREAQARAERESLLNEIGEAIRSTLEPERILQAAISRLLPSLEADRCYFVRYNETRETAWIHPEWRRDEFTMPSIANRALPMSQYFTDRKAAFLGGEPQAVNDVTTIAREDANRFAALGIRSLLRVPIEVSDTTSALSIAMAFEPRDWTDEEIRLVENVATLLHTVLEAALVQQRERHIAQTLQAALQPAPPRAMPGLGLSSFYRPALDEATVGGDFYDVYSVGDNCTALVVADLSGKGLQAASQVSTVRNMLRFALYSAPPVAQAINGLHRILVENNLLTGFATLFVGLHDDKSRSLTYANCGQEDALIWRAATGLVDHLPPTGPVLGGFLGDEQTTAVVGIEYGDILLSGTDGLTEAGVSRRAFLEIEGLASLFAECAAAASADFALRANSSDSTERANQLATSVVERLIQGVETFAGGPAGLRDDIALLVAVALDETASPKVNPTSA